MEKFSNPERIKFIFTEEDYRLFSLYVYWKSPDKKWARFYAHLKPLWIIALFVYFLYIIKGSIGIVEYIILAIGIITSATTSLQVKNNIKRNTAKLFKTGNKSFGGVKEMSFTESHLFVKDNLSKSEINWKSFIRLVETEKHFLIFETDLMAYFIPKRVYKSPTEISTIRNFLKSKISQII